MRSFRPARSQAHPADITRNVLAGAGRENAMEMGHGKTGDCRQHFPVERFVDVLADVQLDIVNAFGITWKALYFAHHPNIIVDQNACSLFQMYHPAECRLFDLSQNIIRRQRFDFLIGHQCDIPAAFERHGFVTRPDARFPISAEVLHPDMSAGQVARRGNGYRCRP